MILILDTSRGSLDESGESIEVRDIDTCYWFVKEFNTALSTLQVRHLKDRSVARINKAYC